MARGIRWAAQNKVSHASHLSPPDVIGSILGITLQAAQTWKRKVCASPVGDEGGGGGLAAAARGTPGAGGDVETKKSKFAKRTWNVPWNQQLHFLASQFTIAIGSAAGGAHVAVFAMCASEPDRHAAEAEA